ncbi:MAG: imidazole glycerol phosphate synthase subunit HisF [Syntrophales bacterium]|nr:imidazole glycerol phosphate synthase subunit HisF [Syntrophales bacterium]
MEQKKTAIRPVTIMPCLDMKDGRVVKGIHFVGLRDAGDPVEGAAFYQAEGADELAMLDIAATLENRGTRLEWVRAVSSVIDIPLTVGGGISSPEDMELTFEAGADRVSVNSAVVKRPDLIDEASRRFGSGRIVVAVDARRNGAMPSGFELVTSGGTQPTGIDAVQWARQCQDRGAGVILPTSMDGDGTREGYDIPLTRAISSALTVPVIASGGAGKLEDFYEAVTEGGARILLAASVFHYRVIGIGQVKEYLMERGIDLLHPPSVHKR